MTDKPDPERIWLSPACDLDAHYGEGRTWANPAPETACEDCGLPWVEYVRADLPRPIPSPQAVEGLRIVFDGPPGPEAGRFVECETPDGRSVNAGTWHERPDGFWELRLHAATPEQPDAVERHRQALMQIELISTNHGAWFENGAWEWGQMMGDAARTALRPSEQSPTEKTAGSERIEIARLAEFIMHEVPGEPSENEGAVDTAIRIMRKLLASPTVEAGMVEGADLARLFHDTYERLAPSFGYETRPDTKEFDPESPNGKLMIAVCATILTALRHSPASEGEG